jgi:hypothetical protein
MTARFIVVIFRPPRGEEYIIDTSSVRAALVAARMTRQKMRPAFSLGVRLAIYAPHLNPIRPIRVWRVDVQQKGEMDILTWRREGGIRKVEGSHVKL